MIGDVKDVDMSTATGLISGLKPSKVYTACQSATAQEIVLSECFNKAKCTLDMSLDKQYRINRADTLWTTGPGKAYAKHCRGLPDNSTSDWVNCTLGQDSSIPSSQLGTQLGTFCEYADGVYLKPGQRCGMQCRAGEKKLFELKATCYTESINFFNETLSTTEVREIVRKCDLATVSRTACVIREMGGGCVIFHVNTLCVAGINARDHTVGLCFWS